MSQVALSLVALSEAEGEKRQSRWRWFQILFAFVYTGVILDVATTALGYARSGSRYEQNPLGGSLIGHLGWFGLLAVLTALCFICYYCVRIVYARMSLRWTILINVIMILIAAFRWLAVGTAIAYLVQTTS